MPKYLLACPCGSDLIVEPRQAGESLACDCGQSVSVPTFREMTKLPKVSEEPVHTAGWSLEQGITFAGGALVIFVALICLIVFFKEWAILDTTDRRQEMVDEGNRAIKSMTYVDGYKFWLALKFRGIGEKAVPDYVINQRRAAVLMNHMLICGGVMIVGGLISTTALFIRRRSPRRRKSAVSSGAGG